MSKCRIELKLPPGRRKARVPDSQCRVSALSSVDLQFTGMQGLQVTGSDVEALISDAAEELIDSGKVSIIKEVI